MKFLLIVIFTPLIFSSTLDQFRRSSYYCYGNLCPAGFPHIACKGLTHLSGFCGARAIEVIMDSSTRTLITDLHNELRNRVALGNQNHTKNSSYPPYPQAARMTTMLWDDELAHIAAFNARRCVNAHDRCRNTFTMSTVGQNIASQRHCDVDTSKEKLIQKWIEAWFAEYADSNPWHIARYPDQWQGPAINHFAQIVSDRSDRIGCAMVSRIQLPWMKKLFVCNYSVMPTAGQPVYTVGLTGSKCKTGHNANFTGLCNASERVDYSYSDHQYDDDDDDEGPLI